MVRPAFDDPAQGVTLRRVTEADWESFRDIRLRALADSPDAFGVLLAESLEHDEAFWRGRAGGPNPTYLVLEDDRPVAMGGGFVPDEPGRAYVWGMWTAPEARGRGHGSAILRELAAWGRSLDLDLVLHVTEGNAGARALYLSHGYVPTGAWEPLRPGSPLMIEELRRSSR